MKSPPKKRGIPYHLFLIPLAMFGFGYLMVPIYNVFCDLTGLNGKTGSIAAQEVQALAVDHTRQVRVEFVSSLNQNAEWDFNPVQKSKLVHPGQAYTVEYIATNQQGRATVGQAVPSVAPAAAAAYFDKTECFCFSQQPFTAYERKRMPVTFVVNPKLPTGINTVTLSYTLFDVTDRAHSH